MGRRLRMYEAHGLYFVTARTFQGRSLLRPEPEVNQVVGGVLARSARLAGVDLHAYVVTSNHLHLLSSSGDGRLSAFMRYLLGNVSRKLGPLVGWRGQFWERRFAAEPILGPWAQVDRLTYLLSHGVKEGLVRHPQEWPGLNCVEQLVTGEDLEFPFHLWSRRWRNGRLAKDGQDRRDPRWVESETLSLKPLPAWGGLSRQARRGYVLEILDRIERAGREAFARVAGAAKVLRRDPRYRPQKVKRTPEPWCHADSTQAWLGYRADYRQYANWYREASARFLKGDLLAPFPPLAFRPPVWVLPGSGQEGVRSRGPRLLPTPTPGLALARGRRSG